MTSQAYTAGFQDKLASYVKEAKFRHEMTSEEHAKANAVDKKLNEQRQKLMEKYRPTVDPEPKTLADWASHIGKQTGRKALSLGRGALSAAGVTGVRALEGLSDIATFVPGLIDSIAFGRLAGVDGGRGFLGRFLGKGHRLADSTVHALRQWSEDYDARHRISSPLNRFTQGAGADALGSFLGFGGLGGVGKKGLAKLLHPLFGTLGIYTGVTGDQYKQLREREEHIRRLPGWLRGYYDATSTAYNQENAPTLKEFKLYHLPSSDLPTSYTGKIRIPRSWRYQSDGSPTQFMNYGE